MKNLSNKNVNRIKWGLIGVCILPFLGLVFCGLFHQLGANPPETITRTTGIWSLRFLIVSLAITPVRRRTGWLWLVRLRRTIALYAFFYASLHVLNYLVFDQFFDWPEIFKDAVKRPYLTAGLLSFVLMTPLALTSTNAMMRRMGGRYWQQLHRLAYPCAMAAVLHYFWLVKQDISRPSIYILVLLLLLFARLDKRSRTLPVVKPGISHSH